MSSTRDEGEGTDSTEGRFLFLPMSHHRHTELQTGHNAAHIWHDVVNIWYDTQRIFGITRHGCGTTDCIFGKTDCIFEIRLSRAGATTGPNHYYVELPLSNQCS